MKLRNSLLLLLTATIWGVAFVAQSVGMEYVEPFTFLCARSIIAGVALLPFVWLLSRDRAPERKAQTQQSRRTLWIGGICCGTALCAASALQQIGLLYTTVGKAGFLTACYILLVPLLGLFFGRKCNKSVWGGVVLALLGLYCLCLNEAVSLNPGDGLMLLCSLLFSVQIMLVDHFSPHVDGVTLSCIQFFVCGAIAAVGMLLWENPSWSALLTAWMPVLYAGLLSSGVGYTLQIIGQRGMNPTVASLIMSLESVVSVLAGWLLLRQALTLREGIGCVLMFAAIVLAQLPEKTSTVRS